MAQTDAYETDAPFEESAAPLEYQAMRRTLQRVRLGAAVALVAIAATGLTDGQPFAWIRIVAFVALGFDAAARIAHGASVVPSIVVDVVVGAIALGAAENPEAPLAVLITYLVIATIMLAGTNHLPWLLASTVGLVAGRMALIQPLYDKGEPTASAILLTWADTAVLIVGIAMLMMAGANRLHAARARQAAALHAERRASEMKNEFVSMVSHELRTPLTNISGFTMAVQESWRDLDGAEVDEFLGIICGEAEHLQNLVDDVLSIPRLEAGRLLLEPVDFELRPAAFRIADLLFPTGGEKAATVQIGGAVIVHADPNRVEQVLRNLFENARKYGGDHVTAEATRSADGYTIVIADNGPGVPMEHQQKIFERFEQVSRGDARSSSGIGLGLTITKRLVEAMGGRLWYEPGFPVGARFCFTLPAGRTSPTTDAVAAEAGATR